MNPRCRTGSRTPAGGRASLAQPGVSHGLSASLETSAASTGPSAMRMPRTRLSFSGKLLSLPAPELRKLRWFVGREVDPPFTRWGSEARAGLGGAAQGACPGSPMSLSVPKHLWDSGEKKPLKENGEWEGQLLRTKAVSRNHVGSQCPYLSLLLHTRSRCPYLSLFFHM